jgi:hypothetical protein
VLRSAASASVQLDVAYYSDGKPSSRHTYRHNWWVPELNRVMMMGARSVYGNSYNYLAVDGFNPDTNTWDAAGTWPDIFAAGHYGEVRDSAGNIWSTGLTKFNPNTVVWSNPGISGGTAGWRSPVSHDSARNQLFCLMWGDGFGGGTGVNASRVLLSGTTRADISFNSGSGLTQFIADAQHYGGMDYDPINDCFLWYSGVGSTAGRVYKITPNSTTTWDIEIFALGAGSVTVSATPGAGCNSKFWYMPAFSGFVLLPNSGAGLHFIRTA